LKYQRDICLQKDKAAAYTVCAKLAEGAAKPRSRQLKKLFGLSRKQKKLLTHVV
jgi:hypothetical protein